MEKEYVSYVIGDNNIHTGSFVNHPIIVQAESLDELKSKSKAIFSAYATEVFKLSKQNDSLEFIETAVI